MKENLLETVFAQQRLHLWPTSHYPTEAVVCSFLSFCVCEAKSLYIFVDCWAKTFGILWNFSDCLLIARVEEEPDIHLCVFETLPLSLKSLGLKFFPVLLSAFRFPNPFFATLKKNVFLQVLISISF